MLGLTSVCVFLFFALALAVTSGYSLGALILLLSSTILLWKRPRLNLQRRDYLIIATLLGYFCIYTLNMLYHGDQARDLDMPSRTLLAIPVLLLLLAYPPRPAAWWAGVPIGAIAGATLAVWQFCALHMDRPQAATSNAIHYGNVSILLGMLALCGLGWARQQRHRGAWTLLLIAGGVAGVTGSVISGSRGGWLVLPVCVCLFAIHYTQGRGKHYVAAVLAAFLALSVVAYAVPESPVRERVAFAIDDLQKFKQSDNVTTSIGQRIEMWRTALELSTEHIWFGLGSKGYMAAKQLLVKEGEMDKMIVNHTNAHNDYIDALVKRGLIGLATLLLLFFLPLVLFAKALHRGNEAARPYALAGVVLCICYPIFGLTTSSLTLNIGIFMLVFPLVMLWAQLRQQERSH
nr:O-antigen ligase family protein [uncultured Janthinobacterium sp.]